MPSFFLPKMLLTGFLSTVAIPIVDVDPTAATITGGEYVATIDMSGLSPGGSATDIEWAVSYGSNSASEWADTGTIAVAAKATPVVTQRMVLPGDYVVYTRELASGSPITSWSSASASDAVTAPSEVTSKSWYAGVMALTGASALGSTIGRTSGNSLKVVDGATMSDSAIEALLPSGANYDPANHKITVSGDDVTLEDFDFNDVWVNITGARAIVKQNIFVVGGFGNGVVYVPVGGHLLLGEYNTVYDKRQFSAAKPGFIAVKNTNGGSGSGQAIGDISELRYNYMVGFTQDPIKVSGSNTTGGSKIHHNVIEACGWVDGNSSWENRPPHADIITARGAFGDGVYIYDNYCNQTPFYMVDSDYGKAGQRYDYAGHKSNKLGDTGITVQNNVFRFVADNGNTPHWEKVRVYHNICPKWLGMQAFPVQASEGSNDAAFYDNIMSASNGDNTSYTDWTDSDKIAVSSFYHSSGKPDYSGGSVDGETNTNLNFWTGAELTQVGTTGDLATAL